MPVDSFDYQKLSIALSFPWSVSFASWLWAEIGLSARLSFEVLWLSAKRSAVPAAICEGAASSHPSLHFPLHDRERPERAAAAAAAAAAVVGLVAALIVHVDSPHMVKPVAVTVSMNTKAKRLKAPTSVACIIQSFSAHFNICLYSHPTTTFLPTFSLPPQLFHSRGQKNVKVMKGLIKNYTPFFTQCFM